MTTPTEFVTGGPTDFRRAVPRPRLTAFTRCLAINSKCQPEAGTPIQWVVRLSTEVADHFRRRFRSTFCRPCSLAAATSGSRFPDLVRQFMPSQEQPSENENRPDSFTSRACLIDHSSFRHDQPLLLASFSTGAANEMVVVDVDDLLTLIRKGHWDRPV